MEIFHVGISPHIRGEDSTRSMMLDVCIALAPALIWGIYLFGLRALVITLLSALSFLLAEALGGVILKRKAPLSDLSALVSGFLFAMILPVSVPLWIIPIGALFAMIVVKGLFGGIGKNFLNPALCAKAFLYISFPKFFEQYTLPFAPLSPFSLSLSQKALLENEAKTPLSYLKEGALPTDSLSDLFSGSTAGNIGQVSALLILAGLLYLLVRGVVTWHIPVSFLATTAVLFLIFPMTNSAFAGLLPTLMAGGIAMCAVFLATDPVTTPVTRPGMILFGILCGIFTFLFRSFTGIGEDVTFAILSANLFVWYLDRMFIPRPYGEKTFFERLSSRLPKKGASTKKGANK